MTKCSFGLVTRERVDTLDIKVNSINNKLDQIITENKNMFNHFTERYEKMFKEMADRLPKWILFVGSIGSSILTGLIMWILTR
jgi:hypothetical protein